MYRIFSLVLFVLLSLSLPTRILAANTGFSVSPPVTEVLLAPNKTASSTLTLKNDGADTSYTLSLHRLIPTDSFGHSTIDPTPFNQVDTPLNIQIQGKEFGTTYPLKSGDTTHFTLLFTSATIEEPLDFYLALVVTADSSELVTASSTRPGISIPLLITLTPTTSLPADIAIQSFVIPNLHDSTLPLTVSPTLENKSPIMLHVKGSLTLTSPSGKVLQTLEFDPTLILGRTNRTLPSFTILPHPLNFGPHHLKLIIQTEGGRNLLESEKIVFIAPIRIIILLLVLLIVIFSIYLSRKRLTSPANQA